MERGDAGARRPGDGRPPSGHGVLWWGGLVVGLAGSVALLFVELDPTRPSVSRTASVALAMATLWVTEALPLAVTALLPVVLFPAFGVLNGKMVSSQYFNHVVFLFLGGFMVALAMERWQLHRRIALRILLLFGTRPRGILLGFMSATAFLSMWISNTATTMMMVTIALAVIRRVDEDLPPAAARRLAVSLLLGVAYGASAGGMATLVGTPPNMSLVRIFEIQFPGAPEFGFARWFAFAAPVSLALLLAAWGLLAITVVPRGEVRGLDRDLIRRQVRELGPLSTAEWIVLADFIALVLLWLFRADIRLGDFTLRGWASLFEHPEYLNDGTVAIALALPLFAIPSGPGSRVRILDWPTAARLPWHIVLLFGGGFALAAGFVHGGLSEWLGSSLRGLGQLPPLLMVLILCLLLTFVTELTSNTATTEMVLPILAGLAASIPIDPRLLMVPVTLSCSCAFMMPVATPPNAIVFGTERLRMGDMARAGLALNLIGAVVITVATATLGRWILGVDAGVVPEWLGR